MSFPNVGMSNLIIIDQLETGLLINQTSFIIASWFNDDDDDNSDD